MFDEVSRREGIAGIGRTRNVIRRMVSGPSGSRLRRILIAVPGVAVLFVGVGHPATPTGKLWHDIGLLFFLTAATLPLWRRSERTLDEPTPWRERLSRALRRTSGILVFGAVGGLIAFRAFTIAGDPSAAHTVSVTGVALLLAAVVPPFLAPVLWPLFPDGLRRPERIARLMEELNKSAVVAGNPARGSARSRATARKSGGPGYPSVPERRLYKDFDADQGAAGRPKPFVEDLGGLPPRDTVWTVRTHQKFRTGAEVSWNGTHLVVTSCYGRRVAAYPVVSTVDRGVSQETPIWRRFSLRRRPPVVAEIVGFDGRNRLRDPYRTASRSENRMTRLVLVDERGRRILTVSPFDCGWSRESELARAAGVPYANYRIDCDADNADEILRLMFPRRPRSRRIRGYRG